MTVNVGIYTQQSVGAFFVEKMIIKPIIKVSTSVKGGVRNANWPIL